MISKLTAEVVRPVILQYWLARRLGLSLFTLFLVKGCFLNFEGLMPRKVDRQTPRILILGAKVVSGTHDSFGIPLLSVKSQSVLYRVAQDDDLGTCVCVFTSLCQAITEVPQVRVVFTPETLRVP